MTELAQAAAPEVARAEAPAEAAPGRLFSLDAFRGFTMICMVGEGFGLHYLFHYPTVAPLAFQFTHADWRGMYAWDLIQPFFMFIVGAVMPIAFERRWRAGEEWGTSLRRVLRRSFLLVFWGLVARSIQAGRPVIDLINVLAQIAFTYPVAFLVLRKSWRVQAATAAGLLLAHWALFEFIRPPGVTGPWEKDANLGWYLDQLILRKTWSGSYATINCLSSAANTIFGVMAGRLLIGPLPRARKIQILAAAGVAAVIAGLALDPLVPIIKKIWTASFAIYSTGFTLLALLGFYWVCDVWKKRDWAKVLVIVGSNSIFIYLFHEILHPWLEQTALVFTGWTVNLWGVAGQILTAWVVILFEIYVCYWLYRHKIFFRL